MLGEITASLGDRDYVLRLTMRSLAALQDEFGQELKPIMGLAEGELPSFKACLRLVELALQKHHPDAGPDVADDILTAEMDIIARLIEAAFPDAGAKSEGKQKAAGL